MIRERSVGPQNDKFPFGKNDRRGRVHASNYDKSALHDHYSSVSTVEYKNEGELMHM